MIVFDCSVMSNFDECLHLQEDRVCWTEWSGGFWENRSASGFGDNIKNVETFYFRGRGGVCISTSTISDYHGHGPKRTGLAGILLIEH